MEPTKHYWLYILHLKGGKYYIGITSRKDPYDRIRQHVNSPYGAKWVKKHLPIESYQVEEIGNATLSEAETLESKRTWQYIKEYGHSNVRGGEANYSGEYVKICNTYWKDDDFKTFTTITLLTVAVVVLLFALVQRL